MDQSTQGVGGEVHEASGGISAASGAATQVNPLSEFTKTYGPFAFGIASLLILWFTIMNPELKSNRVDFQQLNAISKEQARQVDVMHSTATILDNVVKRLERIVEMDKAKPIQN